MLQKLSLIERDNPSLQETDTYMLRLNVIKANTENKVKRFEKLLQNWVSFEEKRFEVDEKLGKISLKPFVDQPVHKDTDSQILQSQLMELKV